MGFRPSPPTVSLDPASTAYPRGYHAGNPGGLPAVDADLVAAKIKDGVEIFGVTGNFAPTVSLDPANTAYPEGYHAGDTGGLPAVDVDLIAENIRLGKTIFGVTGTMVRWLFDLKTPQLPSLSWMNIPTVAKSTALVSVAPVSSAPSLSIPAPTSVNVTAVSSLVIEPCESAWSEYVQAGVTSDTDTGDKVYGTCSARFTITAPVAVGRIATQAIGPFDLSTYRYLKLWVKSSVTIAASDLSIMLDDTAACISPIKDVVTGALVANTWTQVTLDLGDTSACTAIISIGADMKVDKGAFTWRIDLVRATKGV